MFRLGMGSLLCWHEFLIRVHRLRCAVSRCCRIDSANLQQQLIDLPQVALFETRCGELALNERGRAGPS
jgi:hypothetical protein